MATIAPYSPDNTFATTLVVSVVHRPHAEPSAMRTWTTVPTDVRYDTVIADYRMGRTCPQCPFWAGIDRFTHEPIPVPVATLTVDEVLHVLSTDEEERRAEALASADAHREALVEPLLAALDRVIADPTGTTAEEASLFFYGLYLVAKWREPRAYPHVVRWLSLPREAPIDDVALATSWWDREDGLFGDEDFEEIDDDLAAEEEDFEWNDDDREAVAIEPYRAPARVGRNAPCPCGCGKKFKKCCGR